MGVFLARLVSTLNSSWSFKGDMECNILRHSKTPRQKPAVDAAVLTRGSTLATAILASKNKDPAYFSVVLFEYKPVTVVDVRSISVDPHSLMEVLIQASLLSTKLGKVTGRNCSKRMQVWGN